MSGHMYGPRVRRGFLIKKTQTNMKKRNNWSRDKLLADNEQLSHSCILSVFIEGEAVPHPAWLLRDWLMLGDDAA